MSGEPGIPEDPFYKWGHGRLGDKDKVVTRHR